MCAILAFLDKSKKKSKSFLNVGIFAVLVPEQQAGKPIFLTPEAEIGIYPAVVT